MQIDNKEVASLEVANYKFEVIDNKPKIVISAIKLLDNDGNFIDIAKLNEAVFYLTDFPIKFTEIEETQSNDYRNYLFKYWRNRMIQQGVIQTKTSQTESYEQAVLELKEKG